MEEHMKGKKFSTFKTRCFLVALASLTLSVAACSNTPAAPTVSEIAVKQGSVTTEYTVGDQFSVAGGKLVVSYSNKTQEEVDMTLDMIQNVPNMGSQQLDYTVNVLYQKKTTNYVINIRNPHVTGIAVKSGTALKTEYFVGDEFSVAGGVIIATYNNGSTSEVDMTMAMVKNAPDMTQAHENYEVKVEYEGFEAKYTINVVSPSVSTIGIKEGTTLKTEYYQNDEFSVDGGVIIAFYNNGSTQEVPMTMAMVKNAPDMTTPADSYEVKVEYEGCQTTYNIKIIELAVVSIAMKAGTDLQTEYVTGDEFSVANGVIIATLNNGSTKEVTLAKTMIVNEPDMSEAVENYEVIVEYEGHRTSYIINIAQRVYSLLLNYQNRITEENYVIRDLTITGTANKTVTIKSKIGDVMINHYLAKASSEEKYAKLAPSGAIYNYTSDGNSALVGMKSIEVKFEGQLFLEVNRDNKAGKIFTQKVEISSGQAVDLTKLAPSYFILTAGDQEVDIESIEVKYLKLERDVLHIEQFGEEYTGLAGDIVYKATISGDKGKLETLNKENNDVYDVTPSIDGQQLVFAIQNVGKLYFNVNEARSQLTVDGSKGIGVVFNGLALDEVFTVDDFESYSGTGKGWDEKNKTTNTFDTMSGVKANFHADWYSTDKTRGNGCFSGDWRLMGNDDYISLQSGLGRNGSKAVLFKTSNTNGMRYVTYSSLYNVPRTLGKGATFSFWAKGAIKSDGTASSANTSLKVRVLYTNPNNGIDDYNGRAETFTIPAGSDWTEYTYALDANKQYYGYCIYSNSASAYTPIDDIKVYTATPYAKYVAPTPPEPEHHYRAFTGKGDVQFISQVQSVLGESAYFILGLSNDGYAKGYVLAQTFTGTSYDINEETRELTVEGSLDYTVAGQNITVTGITGTFNEDYTVLNNVTFSGTVTNYITNNGTMSIRADALSETQDFTGATRDIVKTQVTRWYMASAWTAKDDYADGINSVDVSTQGYNDNVSLQVRGYTKYSVTYTNDFDPAKNYHGMGYWVKNTSATKNLLAKFFSYTGAGLTGAANMWGDNVTIKAGDGWTLVVCDFVDKSASVAIKNIRFYFECSGGAKEDMALIDHVFYF